MGTFRDFFQNNLFSPIRDRIGELKAAVDGLKGELDQRIRQPIDNLSVVLKTSIDEKVGKPIKAGLDAIPAKLEELKAALGTIAAPIREGLDYNFQLFDTQMTALKDTLVGIPLEIRKRNQLEAINWCKTLTCLNRRKAVLPADLKTDPDIQAALAAKEEELGLGWEAGVLGQIAPALYEGFGALKDTIEGKIGETLQAALRPGTPEIKKVYDSVIDTLIDGLIAALERGGKEVSAELRGKIKSTMKPALSLGLTFTVGSVLAELIHPTKELGFGHVSHFLYDTIGFRSLMEAYIDPLRLNLITQPTKYSINELTTPFLPTEGEITGLARKYEITPDEYKHAMKQLGIMDPWPDRLYNGFWADPRLFEILRLMEVELPPPSPPGEAKNWLNRAGLGSYVGPDWWLAMKFGKAGYDTIDIPVLIKVVKARNLQKELGDIRTLNRNIYKDGGYSREEYLKTLTARGIDRSKAEELLNAIDRELLEDVNKEWRAALEKKFLNGRLGLDELKAGLKRYGMQADRANARAERLNEQRVSKLAVTGDEKVLTRAEVRDLYETGQISKSEAIKRIDDQGYLFSDADMLITRVDKERTEDENAEYIRAYEQRALSGRMTVSALKEQYVKLGKSSRWADGRAMYIEERVLGKEKEA
jgi:hypothetical protein